MIPPGDRALVLTILRTSKPNCIPKYQSCDPCVRYYLGTFTLNNVSDGTATFTFNGTGFWIYGAKRGNHGTYSIEVDGANYPNNNGSSVNDQFMVSLFNLSGLTQGSHTVSLTNTGTNGQYVDIDLVSDSLSQLAIKA